MGVIRFKGLLLFGEMWSAIAAMNFDEASKTLMQSDWSKRNPARSSRMAEIMATGTFEGTSVADYYKQALDTDKYEFIPLTDSDWHHMGKVSNDYHPDKV